MTETTSSSRSLFWGFVAIGAGIFLAGLFVAGALKDIRRTNDEITVTGSAKRPIRADHAIWRPSVTAQNLSVTAAFEQVQSQSNRVVAFLKAQGVADSSVTLRPVETYTVE
jgi:hypothetical protein